MYHMYMVLFCFLWFVQSFRWGCACLCVWLSVCLLVCCLFNGWFFFSILPTLCVVWYVVLVVVAPRSSKVFRRIPSPGKVWRSIVACLICSSIDVDKPFSDLPSIWLKSYLPCSSTSNRMLLPPTTSVTCCGCEGLHLAYKLPHGCAGSARMSSAGRRGAEWPASCHVCLEQFMK